jgi:2'-5' RNA ligase
MYSLFIVPPKNIKEKLETVIGELGKKYGGPVFEPHLTLLPDIDQNKSKIMDGVKLLAAQVKPFKLELGEISFSTTYFQSVLVRIKANAGLMEANLKAKTIFDVPNNIFMPHLSLLYGNQTMKVREEAAQNVTLPSLSFEARSVIITPSSQSVQDPQGWVHLAEIPLG